MQRLQLINKEIPVIFGDYIQDCTAIVPAINVEIVIYGERTGHLCGDYMQRLHVPAMNVEILPTMFVEIVPAMYVEIVPVTLYL